MPAQMAIYIDRLHLIVVTCTKRNVNKVYIQSSNLCIVVMLFYYPV